MPWPDHVVVAAGRPLQGFSRRPRFGKDRLGTVRWRSACPDRREGRRQEHPYQKSSGAFIARIRVMDEPSATLTMVEVDRPFGVIRELRTPGIGIVHVSHRRDEILTWADRVTVLRDGQPTAVRPWPPSAHQPIGVSGQGHAAYQFGTAGKCQAWPITSWHARWPQRGQNRQRR